jgi:hypothetical protein
MDTAADLQEVAGIFELRYGLPDSLLFAMMGAATQWGAEQPDGTAGVYAQSPGFLAFMKKTFGLTYDPTDPITASQATAIFISWAYHRFGAWDMALAAYAWSWSGVAGFLRAKALGLAAQLPAATVAYIRAVAPKFLRT